MVETADGKQPFGEIGVALSETKGAGGIAPRALRSVLDRPDYGAISSSTRPLVSMAQRAVTMAPTTRTAAKTAKTVPMP